MNEELYGPKEQKAIKALSIIFVLFLLFVISGFAFRFLTIEYVMPIGVAFIYLLGFLFFPIGSHKKLRNLIIDWSLGLLGFIIILYAIIPAYSTGYIERLILTLPFHEFVFGVIAMLLLLELIRRTAGVALLILLLLFIFYAFLGPYLPFGWVHKPLDPQWFFSFFYLGNIYYGATEGIFGRLSQLMVTIIAGFLVFSGVMAASGLGKFIIDALQSLTGWMSGGPAKVSIWASALFGTITGSPVAEVMAIGTLTIPAMIRVGFAREIAAGIEAAAGCGGELMPPVMGAGAFIMSEMLGIPYLQIAAAAVLPAILYFFTKFTAIHYYAKAKGLEGLPREQLPKFRNVMKEGGHLIIPLIVLVVLLIILPSIMWAAFYSIIAALVISFLRKSTRIKPAELVNHLVDSTRSIASIGAIIIGADIAASVMATTGLAVAMSNILSSIVHANMLLGLVIAMVGALILGMLVPATAAYIFAAVTFGPPLIMAGLNPLATHMFLFYFAIMGPITPPVALATYAACGIAKADFWKAGFWGTIFALTGFVVPFIFIYDPSIILIGTPIATAIRFIVLALGGTTLAGAIFGYFFKKLNVAERVMYFIASALLIYPDTTYFINAIGLAVFAAVSVTHWLIAKRRRVRASSS